MSDNLELVKQWYVHFDNHDLDYVVASFADDAILIVGDGDSEDAVPYGGRFVGKKQIQHYYAGRFMKAGLNPFGVIRPFCGFATGMQLQFGRWVMIGGEIKDTLGDHTLVYKGQFLHVWSINPADQKVASLSMYFDTPVT